MKYTIEYAPAPVIRDMKVATPDCFPTAFYKHLFPQHQFEERIWAVFLTASNNVITVDMLGQGTINATVVNKMKLYRTALLVGASGVIIIHNHPSNNTRISPADKRLTKDIDEGLRMLDMRLLDHLLYTETQTVSFKQEGLI